MRQEQNQRLWHRKVEGRGGPAAVGRVRFPDRCCLSGNWRGLELYCHGAEGKGNRTMSEQECRGQYEDRSMKCIPVVYWDRSCFPCIAVKGMAP